MMVDFTLNSEVILNCDLLIEKLVGGHELNETLGICNFSVFVSTFSNTKQNDRISGLNRI